MKTHTHTPAQFPHRGKKIHFLLIFHLIDLPCFCFYTHLPCGISQLANSVSHDAPGSRDHSELIPWALKYTSHNANTTQYQGKINLQENTGFLGSLLQERKKHFNRSTSTFKNKGLAFNRILLCLLQGQKVKLKAQETHIYVFRPRNPSQSDAGR